MSFWSDLGNVVAKIGGGVTNAASWVGKQVGDLSGLNSVGEGIGENFGANFGENIPTTFTLNHNVTVGGKIDVSVDVQAQVAVAVNVDVNLKDAITAAEALSDGLKQFDVFGGLFRQLAGDYNTTQKAVPMLRELQSVIVNGLYGNAADRYLIELSFINDSAAADLDRNMNQSGLYTVTADCGCSLSVGVNGKNVIDALHLSIPKSSAPLAAAPRVDREIAVTNLVTGTATNTLAFSIQPFDATQASLDLLAPCIVQLRLLRQTRYWKYTVIEWVFDGKSAQSAGAVNFVVQHPSLSPKPDASPTAQNLAQQIGVVLNQIGLPLLQPPGVAPGSMSQLLSGVLLAPYAQRSQSLQTLLNSFDSLDGDDPSGFDVRTPVFAAVTCTVGSVLLGLSCLDATGGATVVCTALEVKSGDEIAVLLPFAAHTIGGGMSTQSVNFSLAAGQAGGSCSASVYYGLEWATRVIGMTTVTLNLGQSTNFSVPLTLTDRLAGH